TYFFYGKLIDHPKFGTQYEVESFETFVPATEDGLISYLSSDLFPGVGNKTAKAIVDKFGEDAINEILKNPKEVYQIPYLNNKTKLLKVLIEKVKKMILIKYYKNQK